MKNKKIYLFIFAIIVSFLLTKSDALVVEAATKKCESGENCMKLTFIREEGDAYIYSDPAGYVCTARGACTGAVGSKTNYQECCKKSSSVTTDAQKVVAAPATTVASTVTSTSASSGSGVSFTNPLKFETVEDFLLNGILAAIQKIIVVVAVLFIAIGALLYVTAGANPDNATRGKEAITAALIGLALALAGPSLLKDLGATIGWGGTPNAAVNAAPGIAIIALRVLNFILGIMGVLALIMMILGASIYLTSAGSEDQADKGKEMIKYSFLGILIAMASMVIVTQIAKFFI